MNFTTGRASCALKIAKLLLVPEWVQQWFMEAFLGGKTSEREQAEFLYREILASGVQKRQLLPPLCVANMQRALPNAHHTHTYVML